jgi:large subunit ribosomal protein L23Ae
LLPTSTENKKDKAGGGDTKKEKKEEKKAAAVPKPKKEAAPKVAQAPKAARARPVKPKVGIEIQLGNETHTCIFVLFQDKDAAAKTNKAVQKAKKVQLKVIKGPKGTRTRKVRTKVRFYRPKTLKLPRNPKYPKKSHPNRNRLDAWNIIKHPLTTESAMKKIEDNNTLVFITHVKANKHHIKLAVKKLYEIEVAKVNTLIRYVNSLSRLIFFFIESVSRFPRPDGKKKAYVRLASHYDALDIANKIGII